MVISVSQPTALKATYELRVGGGRKIRTTSSVRAHSVLSCICLMPRHTRQSEQHRDQIITKGWKRNTRLSSSFKWAIFSHHGAQHFQTHMDIKLGPNALGFFF